MEPTIGTFRTAFRDQTGEWMANLQPAALWLLVTLAAISLAWRFVQVVIQGGKVELGEILLELVRHIMLVGGVSYLITNAPELTNLLLRSAIQAAHTASGAAYELNAAGILNAGIDLGQQLMAAAGWQTIVFATVAAFLIVGLYAGIAAFVLVCYIEFYTVSAAGVLFLGLAGAPWTSDMAKHYVKQIAGSAAKLYVLYLIVGIGMEIIDDWVLSDGSINFGETLTLFGAVLVLFCITFMLPAIVHGIVAGSSVGAMGPLAMMQTAMNAATSLAGAAVRGGAALQAAAGLTAAQAGAGSLREAVGAAGGGARGVANVAGGMAKNLGAGLLGTAKANALGASSTAGTLEAMRAGLVQGVATGTPGAGAGVEGTITPGGGGKSYLGQGGQ